MLYYISVLYYTECTNALYYKKLLGQEVTQMNCALH